MRTRQEMIADAQPFWGGDTVVFASIHHGATMSSPAGDFLIDDRQYLVTRCEDHAQYSSGYRVAVGGRWWDSDFFRKVI